ncbi:MAG: hypothetical protein JNM27_03440 [Leptospirales bacterium]|nr:hypothetical protein [Leptospirales bacterium]
MPVTMGTFAVFNINSATHSMEEILRVIEDWGHKTKRTKRLDYMEAENEVGFEIVDTDIRIGDPRKYAIYKGEPRVINVFLPNPSSGLQKHDSDLNRKLYNKLKRRFETKLQ